MSNGKLNKTGCEFGRNNRIYIDEIKNIGGLVIKLLLGSIVAPIIVGIVLFLILRK